MRAPVQTARNEIFGADGETRTHTGFPTTPSRWRVYQFHHIGNACFELRPARQAGYFGISLFLGFAGAGAGAVSAGFAGAGAAGCSALCPSMTLPLCGLWLVTYVSPMLVRKNTAARIPVVRL